MRSVFLSRRPLTHALFLNRGRRSRRARLSHVRQPMAGAVRHARLHPAPANLRPLVLQHQRPAVSERVRHIALPDSPRVWARQCAGVRAVRACGRAADEHSRTRRGLVLGGRRAACARLRARGLVVGRAVAGRAARSSPPSAFWRTARRFRLPPRSLSTPPGQRCGADPPEFFGELSERSPTIPTR